MRKLLLSLVFCISSPGLHGAEETPACTRTDYDWFRHSAHELRQFATACKSARFSELNYHRAYFRDLVTESDATASLIDFARSGNRADFSAYTFHMILTEQLARHYFPTTAGRLSHLIDAYEVNNEIAELRLRGYNNLANRLSNLQTKSQLPD